jgi:nicotinic acid mononucleotide adenylyltransferase
MKNFKSLLEAKGGKVVVSFGRMNPMTNGHEKLANKLKSVAQSEGATARLYLSHSTNPKKDPLDFATKVKFAKKAFGNIVQNSTARTIIEVFHELDGKFSDVIVVVGSDRIPEFKTLLNKYNGKDYNFNSIDIVSAGERDPDAEGVEGMSGSKMRKFAEMNDFENFKKGVPSKLSDADAKKLFDSVRKGMNINEHFSNFVMEDRLMKRCYH